MKTTLLLAASIFFICSAAGAQPYTRVANFQSYNQCVGIDDGQGTNLYVERDANTLLWLDTNCEEYMPPPLNLTAKQLKQYEQEQARKAKEGQQ